MPARMLEVDGTAWSVAASGRRTQYNRDEYTLVFTRGSGPEREERSMRYSPLGSKNHEFALSLLTDAMLLDLLRRSQPSWTTPDREYRR